MSSSCTDYSGYVVAALGALGVQFAASAAGRVPLRSDSKHATSRATRTDLMKDAPETTYRRLGTWIHITTHHVLAPEKRNNARSYFLVPDRNFLDTIEEVTIGAQRARPSPTVLRCP
jgi:hypothetical protein